MSHHHLYCTLLFPADVHRMADVSYINYPPFVLRIGNGAATAADTGIVPEPNHAVTRPGDLPSPLHRLLPTPPEQPYTPLALPDNHVEAYAARVVAFPMRR